MKRTVAIIFVALLAVGAAQAADYATNPNPANPPSGGPYSPDAPNITQSADPVNVVTGSVACTAGVCFRAVSRAGCSISPASTIGASSFAVPSATASLRPIDRPTHCRLRT